MKKLAKDLFFLLILVGLIFLVAGGKHAQIEESFGGVRMIGYKNQILIVNTYTNMDICVFQVCINSITGIVETNPTVKISTGKQKTFDLKPYDQIYWVTQKGNELLYEHTR